MDPKLLINGIKIAVFASLLTPFIKATDFYFPFVGPKGLYFMALVEAAFFVWVVLAWRWKQYRPDFKNPLIAAILLFLGVFFASAIFGADFSASFWSKFERMGGVLMFFHLAALAVVVASVFEARDWRRLFCATAGLATIIAVQALFNLSSQARGGGFIGNDSFWATYILFNIFIALYLFLSSAWAEDKKIRIFSGAVFVIMAFCLLLEGSGLWGSIVQPNPLAREVESASAFIVNFHPQFPQGNLFFNIINSGARAAKISFLAGITLLGLLWVATCKKNVVRIAGAAILCAAVLAGTGLIFMATRPGNIVYGKMTEKFSEGTIRGRMVVWEIAWKGFLERPLLGWGPENFNLVFARHYNPCLGTEECSRETWFDRAHNIIFDTLDETGVIGLASYFLIFAAALYILWKGYFAGKVDFVQAGVFTALFGAYFLQNLTVFDMVASYLMWFICLGFIAWLYRPDLQEKKVWPQELEWRQILAPAGVGIICFNIFVLAPAVTGYDTVKAASSVLGSPQRMQLYRETLESSPMGRYQIRLFFASQWVEAMEREGVASKLTQKQIEESFTFIAGELENSMRESPLDYQSQLQLGRLYNSWARFDKSKLILAQDALEKAQKLSPRNQQSYWDLAQTRLYQSRPADAAALAQQAYDLYPNNAQSKTILEQINAIQAQFGPNK